MDNIIDLLQIRIENARKKLPEETVNAIAAVDWKASIMGMRSKHGYTFEQLGDLELETELLLSGLVSPENYPKELAERMKISGREANGLANEMNDLVFKKIREELVKNAERKKIFVTRSAALGEDRVRILSPDSLSRSIEMKKSLSAGAAAPAVEQKPPNMNGEKVSTSIFDSAGIKIMEKKEPSSEAHPINIFPNKQEAFREDILEKIEKPALIEKKPVEEIHPLLVQKISDIVKTPVVKTEYSLNNISKATPAASSPTKVDPYRLSPDE